MTTCRVETPRDSRKRTAVSVSGWFFVALVGVMCAIIIVKQVQYGTYVTVQYGIQSLEFEWKCSACGKVNHVKETID